MKRWRVESKDLWLVYIPWHFPLHLDKSIKGASAKAEKAFHARYPAIYNHLLQYKKPLSNRNQAETGIRYEWYAIQRWGAEYWKEFKKSYIVYPELAYRPQCTWDEQGRIVDCTLYIIPAKGKYLTAVLNSAVVRFFFDKVASRVRGNYIRFKSLYMGQIPIPNIVPENRKILNNLVAEILALKRDDSKNDLAVLERRIDHLVYDLYGLTKDEIAMIEEAVN